MNLPEEAPKLPLLPFALGDILLIATAAVIATRSGNPISPGELLAITVCVVFGAALLVVPFLANYSRQKDAELTERQNQIAALARTTAESADQLSITAAGLNGIAESSKHSVETLAKLPAKIQERLADVVQQVAASTRPLQSTLKDDIAQLQSASEKIARAVAALDTAAKAKSAALSANETELAAALARATAQIDAFIANAVNQAARLSESASSATTASAVITASAEPKPKAPKAKTKTETPLAPPPAPEISEAPLPPPETPDNSPVASTPPPAADLAPEPFPVVPDPVPATPNATPPPPLPAVASEPAAVIDTAPAAFAPAEPDPSEVPVSALEVPEPPKPPRARKSRPDDDIPDLGLTPDPSDAPETALTSDGFTRLIATAYIGIGNKLYVRGDGPGLSWEKGVPLQFVSIGKWRWETPDATGPIRVKLYKNDQIECSGLGELVLEPAHQHEVNAGF